MFPSPYWGLYLKFYVKRLLRQRFMVSVPLFGVISKIGQYEEAIKAEILSVSVP